jgi:DNA-binding TFAR19-related protein (PDSD5 family)
MNPSINIPCWGIKRLIAIHFIRLARPDFARQIEILLIQLYQQGRLKSLSDDQLKAMLAKISDTKRETKINVR